MQKALPLKAIDNAFINHIDRLFDRLVSDLEIEAGTSPEELRNSRVPGAREKFRRSFAFARAAHSEMTSHIQELAGDEV